MSEDKNTHPNDLSSITELLPKQDLADRADGDGMKQANQRGVARLTAVQALYQLDIGRIPLEDVLAEFDTYHIGGKIEDEQLLPADKSYFRMIVKGVFNNQKAIDPAIHKATSEKWTLGRLDATVRAILRAGTFELMFRSEVPHKVVMSEYLDIAAAFFDIEEVKFINAVLDNLRKNLPEDI